MAELRELVRDSITRIDGMVGSEALSEGTVPEPAEVVEGRIRDLIDQLIENLQNVSPEEAAAIMARIEEAVVAFAVSRWIVGLLAVAAAFRLYRQAIKD